MAPPIVVAYRAEWPERAAALVSSLQGALGARVERIDHIGSTSIAAMAAKDIVDLQVSVSDLDAAAADFDAPLGSLGFVRSPYEADHIPAGRFDDAEHWRKRLWTRRGHREGDVNLHVRVRGSANERLALLFRDWFRAHPGAVPAYSAFKEAVADAVPDVDTYTALKDPVVDLVVVVAEDWASSVGWRP